MNDKASAHSQVSLMSSQAQTASAGMGPASSNYLAQHHHQQQQQQPYYQQQPTSPSGDRYPATPMSPLSYQDAYNQQQQHQQQYDLNGPNSNGRSPTTPQQRDHLEQQRLHQQRLQEQMQGDDSLRINQQNSHRVARPHGAAAGRIPDHHHQGTKPPPSYYSYPPRPNHGNKPDDDGTTGSRFQRLYKFPCSTYGKMFMAVFALEAALVIILQSIIVARYFKALIPEPHPLKPEGMDTTIPPYLDPRNISRSIPAYLIVFVFANLFQLVLSWDAVRAQNTIQLIAIVIFNLCCFAYSIFEIPQSRSALLDDSPKVRDSTTMFFVPESKATELAEALKPLLIVVSIVFGVTQCVVTWLAYRLFQEFGWRIYKKIGADPKRKKMYRFYQIYLVLIKVDLFFFVGFSIQFIYLTLTRQTADPEFVITILVLPLTLVILYVAIYAVRHENHFWMSAFIVSMLCGVAYFIFKVVRMYVGEKEKNYEGVRNFLTLFASLCLVTILATIANAAICFRNFGKGLKPHLIKDGLEMQSTASQPGRVMVID